VIAKSFARIYFRNGINQGLLLITCPEAVDVAQAGDTLEIDLERNVIRVRASAEPHPSTPLRSAQDAYEYSFPPLSATALGIINDGGLVQHIRKKLGLTSTEVIAAGGGD